MKKPLALILAWIVPVQGVLADVSVLWTERAQARARVSAVGQSAQIPLPFNPPLVQKNILGAPSVLPFQDGIPAWVVAALPASRVRLREVHPSDGGAQAPFVLLIQDVHQNFEAQDNIAAAIMALAKSSPEEERMAVGVEAAFEPFDLTPFWKPFSDDDREKAARLFLRAHAIAAPSYAGIVLGKPLVDMAGMDDLTHYRANVSAYLEAQPQQARTGALIATQRAVVQRQKKKFLTKEAQALDQALEKERAGAIPLGDHVSFLAEKAAALLGPNGLEKSPHLQRFVLASELERRLDFNKAERQATILIGRLAESLSSSALEQLLGDAVAFKAGNISAGAYYRRLKDKVKKADVSLESVPEFSRYVEYVLTADRIDGGTLMEEIVTLERRLEALLAEDLQSRHLFTLSRFVHLTHRLTQFSLTPMEWDLYQSLHADFVRSLSSPLIDALGPFERFYREADTRSVAMARNLKRLSQTEEGNSRMVVAVVGGFHTPLLVRRLAALGISTAVAQPMLTKLDETAGSAYLSVFAREKGELARLFQGDRLYLGLFTTAAGTSMGQANGDRLQAVLKAGLGRDVRFDGSDRIVSLPHRRYRVPAIDYNAENPAAVVAQVVAEDGAPRLTPPLTNVVNILSVFVEIPLTILDFIFGMVALVLPEKWSQPVNDWFLDRHGEFEDVLKRQVRREGIRVMRLATVAGLLLGLGLSVDLPLGAGLWNAALLGLFGQITAHLIHNIEHPEAPLSLQSRVDYFFVFRFLSFSFNLGGKVKAAAAMEMFPHVIRNVVTWDPTLKILEEDWMGRVRPFVLDRDGVSTDQVYVIAMIGQALSRPQVPLARVKKIMPLMSEMLKRERDYFSEVVLYSLHQIFSTRSSEESIELASALVETMDPGLPTRIEEPVLGWVTRWIVLPFYFLRSSALMIEGRGRWQGRGSAALSSKEQIEYALEIARVDPSGNLFRRQILDPLKKSVASDNFQVRYRAVALLAHIAGAVLSVRGGAEILLDLLEEAADTKDFNIHSQIRVIVATHALKLLSGDPRLAVRCADLHYRMEQLAFREDEDRRYIEYTGEHNPLQSALYIRGSAPDILQGRIASHESVDPSVVRNRAEHMESIRSQLLVQDGDDVETRLKLAASLVEDAYEKARDPQPSGTYYTKAEQDAVRAEAWVRISILLRTTKIRPGTFLQYERQAFQLLVDLLSVGEGELDKELAAEAYRVYFGLEENAGLPGGHSSPKDLLSHMLLDFAMRGVGAPDAYCHWLREAKDSPSYGQMKFLLTVLMDPEEKVSTYLHGFDSFARSVPQPELAAYWGAVRGIIDLYVRDGASYAALELSDELNMLVYSYDDTPERVLDEIRTKIAHHDHAVASGPLGTRLRRLMEISQWNEKTIEAELGNRALQSAIKHVYFLLRNQDPEAVRERMGNPAFERLTQEIERIRTIPRRQNNEILQCLQNMNTLLGAIFHNVAPERQDYIQEAQAKLETAYASIYSGDPASLVEFRAIAASARVLERKALQHRIESVHLTETLGRIKATPYPRPHEIDVFLEDLLQFFSKEMSLLFVKTSPTYRENLPDALEREMDALIKDIHKVKRMRTIEESAENYLEEIPELLGEIRSLRNNKAGFLLKRTARMAKLVARKTGVVFNRTFPDVSVDLSRKERQAILHVARHAKYRQRDNPVNICFGAYFQARWDGYSPEQASQAYWRKLREILLVERPELLGAESGDWALPWYMDPTGAHLLTPPPQQLGDYRISVLINPIDILHLGWKIPGSCLDCVSGTHQEFAAAYVLHPLLATITIEDPAASEDRPALARLNVAFDPKTNYLFIINQRTHTNDLWLPAMGQYLKSWVDYLALQAHEKWESVRVTAFVPEVLVSQHDDLGPGYDSRASPGLTIFRGLSPLHADLLNVRLVTYDNKEWTSERLPGRAYSRKSDHGQNRLAQTLTRFTMAHAVVDVSKLLEGVPQEIQVAYNSAMNAIAPRYQHGLREWKEPTADTLTDWFEADKILMDLQSLPLDQKVKGFVEDEQIRVQELALTHLQRLGVIQKTTDGWLVIDNWRPNLTPRDLQKFRRAENEEQAFSLSRDVWASYLLRRERWSAAAANENGIGTGNILEGLWQRSGAAHRWPRLYAIYTVLLVNWESALLGALVITLQSYSGSALVAVPLTGILFAYAHPRQRLRMFFLGMAVAAPFALGGFTLETVFQASSIHSLHNALELWQPERMGRRLGWVENWNLTNGFRPGTSTSDDREAALAFVDEVNAFPDADAGQVSRLNLEFMGRGQMTSAAVLAHAAQLAAREPEKTHVIAVDPALLDDLDDRRIGRDVHFIANDDASSLTGQALAGLTGLADEELAGLIVRIDYSAPLNPAVVRALSHLEDRYQAVVTLLLGLGVGYVVPAGSLDRLIELRKMAASHA